MWQSPARSWYYYPSCNWHEIATSLRSSQRLIFVLGLFGVWFLFGRARSVIIYARIYLIISCRNHLIIMLLLLCKPSLIFVLALLNQLFDHGLTLLHKLQLYDYLQKYFYLKTHALFLISHIFCAHLLSWSRAWITLPLPIYVMWKFKLL